MNGGFVGRGTELAALTNSFVQASASSPSCVLVRGPGGVGKTTLIRAFLELTAQSRVIWASAAIEESGLPFGVLDELNRQLSRATTPIVSHSLDGEPRDPFVEGAVFLRALDDAQTDGAVVLVIDDVHLADAQSLAALTFALRRLSTDRVVALMTAAPTWTHASLLVCSGSSPIGVSR